MSDSSAADDLKQKAVDSAELVVRAQAGDELARESLFQEIWPVCQRVARRMSASDDDALDIVQDSIVKALLNLPRFDHRSSFKTWMLRIVANTATDHLRRNRHRRVLIDITSWRIGKGLAAEPFTQDNPGLGLERQDLRRMIDAALANLTETTRSAFVLYAEAEMTYQEVADTLGVPLGTVMSRIHSARKKLQVAIEKLDQPTPDSGMHVKSQDFSSQSIQTQFGHECQMTVKAFLNNSLKRGYT
jgi:RNA polymerase sigma-70 factor, ECF subfamily